MRRVLEKIQFWLDLDGVSWKDKNAPLKYCAISEGPRFVSTAPQCSYSGEYEEAKLRPQFAPDLQPHDRK